MYLHKTNTPIQHNAGDIDHKTFKILLKTVVRNRVVEVPKKAPRTGASGAPIQSKCCIGGFRETGLALVIVLRCD